jgi:protein disulfide-isomerase
MLVSAANAQDARAWQPSLDAARRAAAEGNRLVLIYFYGDNCPACKVMQRDTLGQPAVIDALRGNYALVQIDANQAPALATQYGVVALPTTVAIAPGGQLIDKIQGRVDGATLVARMNQTALAARQAFAPPAAQIAAAPPAPVPVYTPPTTPAAVYAPPTPAPVYTPPVGPGGYAPPPVAAAPPAPVNPAPFANMPPPPAPTMNANLHPSSPTPTMVSNAAVWPPAAPATQPIAPAVSPAAPPANPPLCLDGFCPVQLFETQKWTPGDRRYGLVHRGKTYLFAGPEERNRFNANPDLYAPVMSGDDVVLAVERGQTVSGRREHGVFFGKRIYLFADEGSLQRFSQNPDHYSNQALQAMRAGSHPAPVYR